MARGQEETSTNQAGRKRGTPSGVAYCKLPGRCYVRRGVEVLLQVLAEISLELSDGAAVSTIGGASNVVYFTPESGFLPDFASPFRLW